MSNRDSAAGSRFLGKRNSNHWLSLIRFSMSLVVLTLTCACSSADDNFPPIFNTQAEGQHPPSPEEMLKLIELPTGFTVTLFAGEPDVQQPICMDFDDRGRMWVAENYSYSGGPYETKLRDRVIILEDTNGDGKHDTRKVFWDKGFMLTSLTWGFGGLWILHDGTLSFIPDKNGDDIPDSEPVVILDGWSKECGHNFVSGLTWGPDGWLYGRHGIVDTSYPGAPGTPRDQRPRMNCGIWRYHPTRRMVDIVCNGTTNPWGLDYNADGQFFMTNNVQGHLWHVIPGAHYQRMYGQDFNPHAYELMDMTADHYHWDTKTKWNESRDGVANDLGGGHSHVGGMIYQGDNFPKDYVGKIFMCNTHGRRINVNQLQRQGSGYVGRREPDFMKVNTPWFRGVDIKLGPDDVMFVADWSDNGECHDHDGVHRTSGRIYRIAYGSPVPKDVAHLKGGKAIDPTTTNYDWLGRHERRIAQEWAAAGNLKLDAGQGFSPTVNSLLLMESLGLHPELRQQALTSANELTRAEAVHLCVADEQRRRENAVRLIEIAKETQPPNVLLALIGSLEKFDDNTRWQLADAILSNQDNAQAIAAENNLTLMMWYGIEPVVLRHEALTLVRSNEKLLQFTLRRLAFDLKTQQALASDALRLISQVAASRRAGSDVDAARCLDAFKAGLAGQVRVDAPAGWPEVESNLRKSQSKELTVALDSLAILFGDGSAMADLRKLAANTTATPVTREQAISALAQAKDGDTVPILFNLLNDRAVGDAAISALRSFDHPDTPKQLLKRLSNFKDGNKGLAIDTLSSRESYALELAQAIAADQFDARELSAAQVRQLLAFGNKQIQTVLEQKWGVVQETPEARLASIKKWQEQLTPQRLAEANIERGAAHFKTACANCHKLFGEGKAIGPDLTGSNRTNLEFLLINIVDPSAVVPKQFTTSVIALTDGRVITGVVLSDTEQAVIIQTDKEQLTVARSDIDTIRKTGKSLMPDGMLDTLTPEQVRDLFAFMMRK